MKVKINGEEKQLEEHDADALYAILSLKDAEPVLNFFKITNREIVEKIVYLVEGH